jgi:murein DD-endopeptidase MepM/ murein hydrolase activator NlpD
VVFWAALALAGGLALTFANYNSSPDEIDLMTRNEQIMLDIEVKQLAIDDAFSSLHDIQQRDDDIYRILLEADSIPKEIRSLGAGGTWRYEAVEQSNLPNKSAVIRSLSELNKLKRQLYLQSLSLDEIEDLVDEKNEYWAAIPGIQPVSNKKLRRLSTIYGPRLHPILNIVRPHNGLDFMAPKGTKVYATGAGIVKAVRYSKSFGKVIEIDHGHGYLSRYAHLDEYNVANGQVVQRGECIGFVGNTGLSVSDHLHYEIEYNNKNVNPIYYFQRELSNEDYQKLLELSQLPTQPLD